MDYLTEKHQKKEGMASALKPLTSFFQPLLANQKIAGLLKVLLASCFIGICAQIKIPLYFTPVPLAFSTFSVMFVGALLGSRLGALSVICYLVQGLIGLPVWAGGANSGISHFMGLTGGYLIGYVIQAYAVGWFIEKEKVFKFPKVMAILLFSCALQMGIGSLWLAQFVGVQQCLFMGFFPFIPGEIIKSLLLALYIKNRKARFQTV